MAKKAPDAGEILRREIVLRADPARWMREAFHAPDEWQAKVLRDTSSRVAILAPRQSGKSQTVGAKVAHTALYKRDRNGLPTTSLIAAPAERQAILLLRKAKEQILNMGHKLSKDTQSEIIIEGAGQIVALPTGSDAAATARGYTCSGCLVCDEYGFIPSIEEVLAVLAPMTAVHSAQFFAISSASFEGDNWHQIVTGVKPNWNVHNINISECPRMSQIVLDDLRSQLGPMRYAREVENQFSVEGFSPVSLEGFRGAAKKSDLHLDPMELLV